MKSNKINKQHNSLKSSILVASQFTLIALIGRQGSIIGGNFTNLLAMSSIALGIWAIVTMKFKVNVFPEVLEDQKLIQSGPYKYIRHPMYTAVLLLTGSWMLNEINIYSISLCLLFLLVLLTKINHEEKLLTKAFKEYSTYMKKTKKLIPFIC